MFVKWYQFRSEVSVFVWGVGGSRGVEWDLWGPGEEERVGQELEQAWSGYDHPVLVMVFLRPRVLRTTLKQPQVRVLDYSYAVLTFQSLEEKGVDLDRMSVSNSLRARVLAFN